MNYERKFLPTLERHPPIIIDNSVRKELKDCARRAFYKYWLNKVPAGDIAPPLVWGTAYHKFREVLELTGSFTKAVEEGMVPWDEAYPRGIDLENKLAWMTKERLLRTFGVGFTWWSNERKQGDIKVMAVETPFNVELPDGSKISGRLDQMVKWHGQVWIRDFKTTAKEEQMYKRSVNPNAQFDTYVYAGEKLSGSRPAGAIVEVMYNEKEPAKRRSNSKDTYGPLIYSLMVAKTAEEIEQWIQEELAYQQVQEIYEFNDVWPKNESQCSWCPFHIVCTMQTEEGMITKLEDTNLFHTRIWDNASDHLDKKEEVKDVTATATSSSTGL